VSPPPRSVLERRVFSIADRNFRWQDVLDAGRHWGGLAALERQAAAGIAALDRAAAAGRPLSEREIDAEVDLFRHEQKLLAAEEMTAWLARWELAYDDLLAYGGRVLARARLDGRLEELVASSAPDPARVADVLWAETVCCGALAVWAWRLAGQLASADAVGVSPDSELAAVEQASEERSRRSLTQEVTAKVLQARRSDWVEVECTVLELRDEGMAREAALSVADEGLSLSEIAVRAGAPVAERTLSLEEAEPELARALLGATAGDVVGPVAMGNRFVFAAVRGKRAPTLDDPLVRTRVQEEVRRRAIDTDIGERILWHERP
jgi:hypothetical protein